MTIKILKFVSIIVGALLAGTSFGIWMGLNPVNYTPATYLEQQHNLVGALNTLMVSLVVVETLMTIALFLLLRKNNANAILFLVAAVCFAACILISRFGNLPIQNEMQSWSSAALPEHWTLLRDKWWSLHQFRTLAELVGLAFITWSTVNDQKSYSSINR
ncbi:MAG: DUF1772 domain-containing protein [Saprospiraceae bacterium]